MTRVREESWRSGPRPGMLTGLAVTGGVITSAGVVLAATFGALGTIPILFLQQTAFLASFRVLLDTLVVRSLLVPAAGYYIGRLIWWPSRLSRSETSAAPPSRIQVAEPVGEGVCTALLMDDGPVRVGLVGYGSAGRGFHAPLLREGGLEIRLVATADPGRRRQLDEDVPGAEAVDTPEELFGRAGDVELVVLASPSAVHVRQATAALDAGLPVVAAKPLATDAASARGTVQHAARVGVPLAVFQNRRWDAEQLTLRALLHEGRL